MTDLHPIARWRLLSQRLVGERFRDPAAAVRGLFGVQAEQPAHTAWALACRSAGGIDELDVGRRCDDGEILRTHVLRPTWHYVVPDDIVWLCELGRERLDRQGRQILRRDGVADQVVERALGVIVAEIERDGPLTRHDLRDRLAGVGIDTPGSTLTQLTALVEYDGLICSGVRRNGEHTYDLVARRAPHARRLDPDSALMELARRYLASHGPATDRDLAYWASLPLGRVRHALRELDDELSSFEHDGRRYWHVGDAEPATLDDRSVHLLIILDEMYRGYQDSRSAIDAAGVLPGGRETALGMVLVDGQFVAGFTRTIRAGAMHLAVRPLASWHPRDADDVATTARDLASFHGLADVEVRVGGDTG